MTNDRNVRTVLIKKETHSRVKKYCDECGLKMNGWIDSILRKTLDNLNHK